MLTTAELAAREDFLLGEAVVSPSTRTVGGPGGQINVEPRVMQVLVALADAKGSVVTRDHLFSRCWGVTYVGDDSLNRAVAGVRKIAEGVAAGSFTVDTVRRTGYRIVVRSGADVGAASPERPKARSPATRRTVVGGVAATLTAAGIGLWTVLRPRSDARFEGLMERGKQALRLDEPGSAKYFEQAVAIEPRNPKALGLFAYALASGADNGPQAVEAQTAQTAERAARTALAIEPNEPNALLAMTFFQSVMLDWIAIEEEYRRILATDPDNTLVMRHLGSMLHGVGRCRESLAVVERAIAIEPLTPDHQFRKAMRLWVLGRTAEADRVINRAMELWPSHRLVRMARLMIYEFTGRAQAALAMVEDEEKKPIFLSPASISIWRSSLLALESPTASAVEAARQANVEGARATPAVAAWAILALSALGELDAAFDVANGFLLGRGSVIVRPRPEAKLPAVNRPGWRNTYGLFTPPTKAMRLDPRFQSLAQGLGLTEYWQKRGIGPDAFLFTA
jgi:DNA-binding winged helix-turn-helix (wHTH) protein/tetratricopeptide (TPR) repeat protein